jgi:hypothetical protein
MNIYHPYPNSNNYDGFCPLNLVNGSQEFKDCVERNGLEGLLFKQVA